MLTFLSSRGKLAFCITAHTLDTSKVGSFEFAFGLLLETHITRL